MIDPKIYYPGAMMVFGSVIAATLTAIPRANKHGWMIRGVVPALANIGGFVTGIYSIWFFGSRLGWGTGLLWWVGLGFLFAFIARLSIPIFPLLLIFGIACMYVGFVLALVW